MGVDDTGALSEVGKGSTASRSTEQHGVGSGGCPQGQLVEGDALSSGGNDALAGVLGEGEGAHGHLGAFEHADIISDLSNNNGGLSLLLGHVLGKTVQAHWGGVDLGHVKALGDGGAELGVSSAGEELVKLDEKPGVRVLRLDGLHGRLVAGTAATCFKIDTHVELFISCGC